MSYTRFCPWAEAWVNQLQPLIHAISRGLKRLGVEHSGEDGPPSLAVRDLRRNIIVWVGELRYTSMAGYRHKVLLADETFVNPKAAVHLQGGSATVDC